LTDRRLLLLLGPFLAILLYLPTLRCGFVFDDRGVILLNPLMHDVGSLPRLLVTPYWNSPGQKRELYRPLTSVSFAVDSVLSGMRPAWFHAVNILLHALVTLMVVLLAHDLSGGRIAAAAVAGVLFAVHPIHVESVAGIVGRSELLAALGVLTAVACHRRALRQPRSGVSIWSGAAWAATLCGMLAKESAIVAPVLCALSETVPPHPSPKHRARAIQYAGYAACAALYLGARAAVLGSMGPGQSIPFVDNPAASAGPIDGRLTGLGTLVRYAAILAWPRNLSADYSYAQIPIIRSLGDPLALGGLTLALVVIASGLWLLPRSPFAGFAFLLVAVGASLTTNITLFIGTLLAERLMYLPSVGLCLLAGWVVERFPRGAARSAALAVTAFLVALLFVRSWARIPDWTDDFSLYSSAARVSPQSARIRYNLGNAYLQMARYRDAEASYRAALAIYPEFQDARVNLGMALVQQGHAREALELLLAAAQKDPGNADLAVNLGTAYRSLDDPARAEQSFRRALELDAHSSRAWNNLGSIELRRGEVQRAIVDLEAAVRLEPDMAIYRINLADALTAASRAADAAREFEAAFRLDPDLPEAHRGLGEVALARGDREGAEREFRLAATASKPSARAANFLGYLRALKRDYAGAAESYEEAVALDPGLADAHRSLGILYAEHLGNRERAVAHLKDSLRIDPVQPRAQELRKMVLQLEGKSGG
jgi:protein O-mannosyl-transferase